MSELSLLAVSRFEGIADLPIQVRGLFAHAWLAEHEGKAAEAADYLDKAVMAEAKIAAS
jgi:hypothetical protein